MFVGRVEQLNGESAGKAPALSSKMALGWEGLGGANTLAYYDHP